MSERIHISFPVTDLDRSVSFYAGFFGQEPSKRHPDYANFRLDHPPIHLALTSGCGPESSTDPGTSHFGVELPDQEELDRWQSRLEKAGLPVRTEERETCCYATANKLWTSDPEGRSWEVWVRLGDADRLRNEADTCCVPRSS